MQKSLTRLPPPKKTGRQFLFACLFATVGFISLIAAFNWLVNPYRLYFKNSQPTQSDKKPRPEQLQQEIRSSLLLRSNADTIIFGNSMMEIGVNPESQVLSKQGYRVFNMGIAGFTLGSSTAGLLPALNRNAPKNAIIAASFSDYLMQGPSMAPTAIASYAPSAYDHVRLLTLSLLSGETTLDSFKTLTINRRTYPQTITAYGHNPMLDYKGHVANSGYRVVFNTANLRIHESFQKFQSVDHRKQGKTAKSLDELRSLVKVLQSKGTSVTIVINPLHIDYIASINKFQLTNQFEQWKRDLAQFSSEEKVAVIDFGCQGQALAEPIPALGDRRSEMNGYWDAQHFKPSLGDQMVVMALNPASAHNAPSSLTGIPLNNESIELHNKKCASFFESNKHTLRTQ